MNTNETQLIEAFGDKIDGYVQTLATKAGVGIDHFWPMFIKQQQIEGWSFFIIIALVLLLSTVIFLYSFKRANWDNAHCLHGGLAVVSSSVGAFFLTCLCVGFSMNLSKIINPEYQAIKEIVSMIK